MEKTSHPVERPNGRRCADCKFFGVRNGASMCRYNPPQQFATFTVVGIDQKTKEPVGGWQQSAFFPLTLPEEWCGKFERATDA